MRGNENNFPPPYPPQGPKGNWILASILSIIIAFIAFVFSLERAPETGAITINPMILFIGFGAACLLFVIVMPKTPKLLPSRPCSMCGRPMPFDGVVCPYCDHDYR